MLQLICKQYKKEKAHNQMVIMTRVLIRRPLGYFQSQTTMSRVDHSLSALVPSDSTHSSIPNSLFAADRFESRDSLIPRGRVPKAEQVTHRETALPSALGLCNVTRAWIATTRISMMVIIIN